MKKLLSLYILLFSSNAFASYMGNGPAAYAVLIIGTPLAIFLSYYYSRTKNDDGSYGEFDGFKFIGSIILSALIILILTVAAAFA